MMNRWKVFSFEVGSDNGSFTPKVGQHSVRKSWENWSDARSRFHPEFCSFTPKVG